MNKQNDSRSRGRVRGTCLSQSVQQTSTGQPATDVMKGSDRKGEKEREREKEWDKRVIYGTLVIKVAG